MTTMRKLSDLLALIGTLLPLAAQAAPSKLNYKAVELDRAEESVVYFKTTDGSPAPGPLKTGLFDMKYLGVLRPEGEGLPNFIFTARPCQNCMQDSGVYLLRPMPGRPDAFVYPGKILEPKTRAVVLEARAFFGRCLKGKPDVYLIFQKERIDRRPRLQTSVFIAQPSSAYHLEEKLLERHLPRLEDTLKLVRARSCREIEGRNRLMLTKPLDLSPRHVPEEDKNDDDDSPKENQTDKELPAS